MVIIKSSDVFTESRKKKITGFLHDNVNMLLVYSESCEHCSTKTEGDMSCERHLQMSTDTSGYYRTTGM